MSNRRSRGARILIAEKLSLSRLHRRRTTNALLAVADSIAKVKAAHLERSSRKGRPHDVSSRERKSRVAPGP